MGAARTGFFRVFLRILLDDVSGLLLGPAGKTGSRGGRLQLNRIVASSKRKRRRPWLTLRAGIRIRKYQASSIRRFLRKPQDASRRNVQALQASGWSAASGWDQSRKPGG